MRLRAKPATREDVVVAECANYVVHGCMGDRPCVVLAGGTCDWFEQAIRPLYPEILVPQEEPPAPPVATCDRCGDEYTPTGRHSLYCAACASEVRRERTRERVARHRALGK